MRPEDDPKTTQAKVVKGSPQRRLAGAIREYRTKTGISQRSLAEQLNMSASQLSRLISGKRKSTPDGMLRIAQVIGITPDEIGLTSSDRRPRLNDYDPGYALAVMRRVRRQRQGGDPARAYVDLQEIVEPTLNWARRYPTKQTRLHVAELLLVQTLLYSELLPLEELDKPARLISEAWELVRAPRLDRPSAYILSTLGNCLRRLGLRNPRKVHEAMPFLQRALTYDKYPGEVAATAMILAKASSSLRDRSTFTEAVSLARRSLDKCGDARSNALVSSFALTEIEARGHLLLSDAERALKILDGKDRVAEMLAIPQWHIIHAITRAEILAAQGSRTEVASLLNDAIKASGALSLPQQIQRILLIATRYKAACPDLEGTIHLGNQQLGLIRSKGHGPIPSAV